MFFKKLSLENSKKEYAKYLENKGVDIELTLPIEYRKIRQDLLNIAGTIEKSYSFDLKFGTSLYVYFNQLDGFNESIASNYDFWRYLSIKVVPDIVEKRHGLVPAYYYEKNVRIYLSTLWWFIHLTYQGTIDKTLVCLKELNTDYILQLVERPGKNGIYVDIMRCIIRKISKLPIEIRNQKLNGANLFRRIMIQNTAKFENYNLVFEGKVDEYVDGLFKSCNVSV